MKYLSILTLLTLAACGADGAPTAPTGVAVTGEASMGVTNAKPATE